MTAKIEHQPRERSVPCQQCRRRDTWEVSAVCKPCAEKQAKAA